MYNFTESELLFIAQATCDGMDNSNIMIMMNEWDYTPQQIGGFISSINKKAFCQEFEEKGFHLEMKKMGQKNWKYASKHFWFPRDEMEDYYFGGDKNPTEL